MISEGKKTNKNTIKQIGLDIKPVARQIVIQIANALGLKIKYDYDENKNIIGVSAYAGDCLRLSDHRTYLQTWVDAGTWQSSYRYDIVIEDSPTLAKEQVKDGYDFTVTEFVINTDEMNVEKAKTIAYDIRETLNSGRYANNVGAEKRMLKSNHGQGTKNTVLPTQNNESNTRKVMKQNKKTINEAQLRAIVKEAVKSVLNERSDDFGYTECSMDDVVTALQKSDWRYLFGVCGSGEGVIPNDLLDEIRSITKIGMNIESKGEDLARKILQGKWHWDW